MVTYASLGHDDTVLDIGAGLGFLTRFMAERCKKVLAVEADTRIAKILCEQLADAPNVKVIEGNILEAKIPPFNRIISTPPYNISSPLLLWILEQSFDCAVLVLQKEFAHRLVAPIGNRDYGWLTVWTYCSSEVELLDDVPKAMFYPQPKVDSVITRLTPKRSHAQKLENKAAFKRLVQLLFTQRNKKLRSAVLPYLKAVRGLRKEDAVQTAERLPFRDKRIRELAPEDFGALANAITQ
jgi:16S rRNA (adenine1518-N6/adenine1519-N6)-dimethyltransferase